MMDKVRPLAELARYRARRKLTTQALAEEMGVSRITVWRWENGKRRPDKSYALRLAEMTGVPVLEIMGVTE
jgi:transcriptional regulator with XRE-family HTH domain